MATIITPLDTSPGFYEDDWTVNFTATNISTATDIKAAVADTQHGIKGITILAVSDVTEWVKILDGTEPLIGPVPLASGIPLSFAFNRPVYCTKGNALKIQTKSAIAMFCIVRGITGVYPEKASSPSPANEASGIGLSTDLSWTAGGSVISNDVYFGTSNPPELIGNQSETTYNPSLVSATTYYWRIDTRDDGSVAEGDVWSFTTA